MVNYSIIRPFLTTDKETSILPAKNVVTVILEHCSYDDGGLKASVTIISEQYGLSFPG